MIVSVVRLVRASETSGASRARGIFLRSDKEVIRMVAMIGVASLLGEERRCLQALKRVKAISNENAVKLNEISDITGLSRGRVELAIQRLIARGKVEKTKDEKYYAKCGDRKHC